MSDHQFEIERIMESSTPTPAVVRAIPPTLSPICDICAKARNKGKHTKCSQKRKALYEQRRAAGQARPAKFN